MRSGDRQALERGKPYRLVAGAAEPPAPYEHQIHALQMLHATWSVLPPVSGIVHLPTGAGKTRVALQLIAQTLQQEPDHRFVWATDARVLISQTMSTAGELAALFPAGTLLGWHQGESSAKGDLLADERLHLVFVTRRHLSEELSFAADGRRGHPWRARILAGKPLTVVYDECHQLGAEGLQESFDKLYQKVVDPTAGRHRFRVIGLSATPIPTRASCHELLETRVFPLRSEQPSAAPGWRMHVFHRVENADLLRAQVLCPVAQDLDQTGIFDIPAPLLREVIGETHLPPPPRDAQKDEVMKYALRFNKSVMGDPRVLRFLADRLARNLERLLGKTIVFVPNIAAADTLVALLDQHPNLRGLVAAVHSDIEDRPPAVPDQPPRTPEEVLREFKDRGARPCILVNVDMLTEGFDDPKVQTVVLAKLTLSTNRFWQMIGRGTRGLRAGGTEQCFVVDPIKLMQLYDYFGGYQPSLRSLPGAGVEDEPGDQSRGALPPSVPVVSRPPLPSAVHYDIAPQLRRLHAAVAAALEAFLRRDGRLGEQEAVDIARAGRVSVEDGGMVVQPGAGAFDPRTGVVLLRETLARVRRRTGDDLSWVSRALPDRIDEGSLRSWWRGLHAIEKLGLHTEHDYQRAGADGRLGRELSTPVPGTSPDTPPPTAPLAQAEPRSFVVDVASLCTAVARADGQLLHAELDTSAWVLVQLTGTADGGPLRAYLSGLHPAPADVVSAAGRVAAALDEDQRHWLLYGLTQIAAADGFVHPEERRVIEAIAAALGTHPSFVSGLFLGAWSPPLPGTGAPAGAAPASQGATLDDQLCATARLWAAVARARKGPGGPDQFFLQWLAWFFDARPEDQGIAGLLALGKSLPRSEIDAADAHDRSQGRPGQASAGAEELAAAIRRSALAREAARLPEGEARRRIAAVLPWGAKPEDALVAGLAARLRLG